MQMEKFFTVHCFPFPDIIQHGGKEGFSDEKSWILANLDVKAVAGSQHVNTNDDQSEMDVASVFLS